MLNKKTLLKSIVFAAIAGLAQGVAPVSARIDEPGSRAISAPATIPAAGALLVTRLRQRPQIFARDTNTAALGALPGLQLPVARPVAPDYNVFRSVVVPVGTLPAFDQWAHLSPGRIGAGAGLCTGTSCDTRTGRRLAAAAAAARQLPPLEALRLVNAEVNAAIRYRSDKGDHWATLAESIARGTGDCEDYAIAKMTLLRSIGFLPEQLQFVVLKDARKQLYHAVLAVHVEGKRYILDNLSTTIAADSAFRSYLPIVSFIGDRTFIHGFKGKSPAALSGGFASVRPGEGS